MTIETFWPYGVGPGPLDELLAGFFREPRSDGSRLARSLTEDAVDLLRLAVRQAGQWGNPTVDTEHLLWAATNVDDSRQLLDHEGFRVDRIARSMEGTGEHHDQPDTEQLAFAPAARRAVLEAARVAWAYGDRFVGAEHIVLALAAHPDDTAGRALRDTGLPERLPVPYGRDLTDLARQDRLDPIVDRVEQLDRLVEGLTGSATPVLIGEPGVGKTAVLEGLAQRIDDGSVPKSLLHKRVLDAEQLSDVVRELPSNSDAKEVIVGLDGIDDSVAPDRPRVVVMATPEEHLSLEGETLPIVVPEATVQQTVEILNGLRDRYADHHRVHIDDSALPAAAELADRYLRDGSLPAKAIDLLDLVAACLGVRTRVVPRNVPELERRLAEAARNGDHDVPTITRTHVADVVAQLATVDSVEIRGEV